MVLLFSRLVISLSVAIGDNQVNRCFHVANAPTIRPQVTVNVVLKTRLGLPVLI